MVIPPPMPSKPAMKPTTHPMTRNTGISVKSKLRLQHLLGDERPLSRIDRRDRQPVASRQNAHARKLRPRAQVVERNEACLLDQGHLDVNPARRVSCRLWVIVRTLLVKLRLVGIGGPS